MSGDWTEQTATCQCGREIYFGTIYGNWLHDGAWRGCRAATFDGEKWDDSVPRNQYARPERDDPPEPAAKPVKVPKISAPKSAVTRAQRLVTQALKEGRLTRPLVCSLCGRPPDGRLVKINAHHHDYSQPLDVIWLCHRCHASVHKSPWLTLKADFDWQWLWDHAGHETAP